MNASSPDRHINSIGRRIGLPFLALGLLAASALLFGTLWAGYELGRQSVAQGSGGQLALKSVQRVLESQRDELDEQRRQTQDHLDALSLRLGTMQSEILRIEALGAQLVKAGELDPEEFNFDAPPARGGLSSPDEASSTELSELVSELETLSLAIEDRAHKLELMQGLIVEGKVQEQLKPQGRPIDKGWISSRYGYRKDPFTGKKAFHHGIDFAGKKGSKVYAVASGIVTQAKRKVGYGYLVEIAHADGLVTRYAHNSKIFVQKGDLVNKGDTLGLMGSTGRSTGPHVHFEIVRNGKSLNPQKYLRQP